MVKIFKELKITIILTLSSPETACTIAITPFPVSPFPPETKSMLLLPLWGKAGKGVVTKQALMEFRDTKAGRRILHPK